MKEVRLRGWTINTAITPPDGITYGLGCESAPYPFSIDLRFTNPDGSYRYTYASGRYDSGDGSYTLSL